MQKSVPYSLQRADNAAVEFDSVRAKCADAKLIVEHTGTDCYVFTAPRGWRLSWWASAGVTVGTGAAPKLSEYDRCSLLKVAETLRQRVLIENLEDRRRNPTSVQVACPKCHRQQDARSNHSKHSLYYCDFCRLQFDSNTQENGDFSDDPTKRIAREESRTGKSQDRFDRNANRPPRRP
jgi:hypothetical protein